MFNWQKYMLLIQLINICTIIIEDKWTVINKIEQLKANRPCVGNGRMNTGCVIYCTDISSIGSYLNHSQKKNFFKSQYRNQIVDDHNHHDYFLGYFHNRRYNNNRSTQIANYHTNLTYCYRGQNLKTSVKKFIKSQFL